VLRFFNEKELVDEVHFDEDILTDFTDKDRYSERIARVLRMWF
jgi:hypothetical protein